METKPLFVGEAPSHSTQRKGAHPLVGESGRRLATWAGMSAAEFQRAADLVNLYPLLPEKWDNGRATELARALWNGDMVGSSRSCVVLLGNRVARAFGFTHLETFRIYQTGRSPVALIPHPSGRNLFWNTPANVKLAEEFLHCVLRVSHREPKQGGLMEGL